jgi:nucleoside 2-deoxyribosyltransferase
LIEKIYLAGGMQNLTFKEQTEWRDYIKRSLKNDYLKLEIVDPTNYYNFETVAYDSNREVKEWDLNEVRTSDLIIVYFNDPNSIGTAQELQCANEHNIPVIGIYENQENRELEMLGKPTIKLHPWLVESCNKIFDNRAECVDYIKKFYLDGRRLV